MEAEAENQTVDAKIDGCFADRMDDVRRRLLHVLGLNHGTVEVCLFIKVCPRAVKKCSTWDGECATTAVHQSHLRSVDCRGGFSVQII